MGQADLACAECNCFPHLMVNLRPARLLGSPYAQLPTPTRSAEQKPGTHTQLCLFCALGLWLLVSSPEK